MPKNETTDVADELLQWAAATSPADPRGDLAEKAAREIKWLRILNGKLCDALREIRRDVEESADDVVWMRGGIETVCDRITAVLGNQHEQE